MGSRAATISKISRTWIWIAMLLVLPLAAISARRDNTADRSSQLNGRGKPRSPHLVVYYLRFTSITEVSVTTRNAKTELDKIDVTDARTIGAIMDYLRDTGRKGTFMPHQIRVLVEPSERNGAIWVDAEGAVRSGGRTYQLQPTRYLLLDGLLTNLIREKVTGTALPVKRKTKGGHKLRRK
jgi:hypothetical protein